MDCLPLKQRADYIEDIKCYRKLSHYQREHVIMCRCGKFPHLYGISQYNTGGRTPHKYGISQSSINEISIVKYHWNRYCVFCLELYNYNPNDDNKK